MAKPNQAARTKRDRERAQKERQQEKQEKRSSQRDEQKRERERMIAEGIDPDLAGIIPGPQPTDLD